MAKLSAAHITYHPVMGKTTPPWQVHKLADNTCVVTINAGGEGGAWDIKPAPFIETGDPAAPLQLVTVFDSITVGGIGRISSSSRVAVAGYDDGTFNDIAALRRAYPNHVVIPISVRFGDKGKYGDCERGDMTVEQVLQDFARGNIEGVYASKDTWNTQIVHAIHGWTHQPLRWVADWTGEPHLPTLVDGVRANACQWDNHAIGRVNADVSLFEVTAL